MRGLQINERQREKGGGEKGRTKRTEGKAKQTGVRANTKKIAQKTAQTQRHERENTKSRAASITSTQVHIPSTWHLTL